MWVTRGHETVITLLTATANTDSRNKMNFSSDGHRLPRINSDEAKDIVNRIPIFKNLIKPNSENKSASVFENKTMEGYLYLSRYNNSENHVQSKNLSIQLKTDEQSDNNRSHIESPIISSPVDHPAMSHKEQKRKFAISLATLSAKPHKRKTIIEGKNRLFVV